MNSSQKQIFFPSLFPTTNTFKHEQDFTPNTHTKKIPNEINLPSHGCNTTKKGQTPQTDNDERKTESPDEKPYIVEISSAPPPSTSLEEEEEEASLIFQNESTSCTCSEQSSIDEYLPTSENSLCIPSKFKTKTQFDTDNSEEWENAQKSDDESYYRQWDQNNIKNNTTKHGNTQEHKPENPNNDETLKTIPHKHIGENPWEDELICIEKNNNKSAVRYCIETTTGILSFSMYIYLI